MITWLNGNGAGPQNRSMDVGAGYLLVCFLAGIAFYDCSIFLGIAFDFDGVWVFYCFGVAFYFGAVFLCVAFDLYFFGIGGVYEQDHCSEGESQKFIHVLLLS